MEDIDIEHENRVLHAYYLFIMDILKVGHNGSKYSDFKDFASMIQLKISLISVVENN